jgi:hypothetical protein
MPVFDKTAAMTATKTYSQENEDGLISYIMSELKLSAGFFVEFGVGPAWKSTLEESGLEANCRLLREMGWHGLFMDGSRYAPEFGVEVERVTALNINRLFQKYSVPQDVDLVSIDVDGQDFWIWMNLGYFPKVVVIEYNPNFTHNESVVVPFDINFRWDATKWYGASLRALDRLGRSKGYLLTYTTEANAFFIQRRLVQNADEFRFSDVYRFHDIHRPDFEYRPWITI